MTRRHDAALMNPPVADRAGRAGRARAPHERILNVARELFCREGIHAVGIDRILAEAGASKMTLYSRYGSKEALLHEALRQEGAAWRTSFFAAVIAAGADAPARLRGVIAALDAWYRGGRFYGCAFINAVGEHAKGEPHLRALAGEHHRDILDFLGGLAAEAGYGDPAMVARQILLLMDGVTAALMVTGDESVLAVGARNLDAVLAQR
ncbi:MAG: TetR/AcrR family transcriptional regulator [Rhodospirillales bacterium]|nr:TetR/AcrR family transcriptional regulator [Rhodospirillales bacterium]MDE2197552.1 TetR/AcrR family transcriptional regulator [Rhodospirillales bacterium]MDE2573992.1 TetR/AcrR family transcriptional regulator [Rhodospirillales bacterium]